MHCSDLDCLHRIDSSLCVFIRVCPLYMILENTVYIFIAMQMIMVIFIYTVSELNYRHTVLDAPYFHLLNSDKTEIFTFGPETWSLPRHFLCTASPVYEI